MNKNTNFVFFSYTIIMKDKIYKILSLYKTNRNLFNNIIFTCLGFLIVWQLLFTLILPLRVNILMLIVLIILFCYFFFKIEN
jgi:Flp pilus assembly protein TadB